MRVAKIIEAECAAWKKYRAFFIIIPGFVYCVSVFLEIVFDLPNLMIVPLIFTPMYAFVFLSIYAYYEYLYFPELNRIDNSKYKVVFGGFNSNNTRKLDASSDAGARVELVRGRCFQVFWICWAWLAFFVFLLPAVLVVVAVALASMSGG